MKPPSGTASIDASAIVKTFQYYHKTKTKKKEDILQEK